MKAKKEGDKAKNLALKLVVNTTYGASLNKYNDLYDPLMGRSVCVSGQLYLLEMAEHLYQTIPDLQIVQLNTDGIMIEFDDSYEPQVKEIVDEWQARTGFELEEDKIEQIFQKDVNNYCEIHDGEAKAKGGYLVKGIAPAGAFNINNNACVVATALKEYFLHGTPPEETVNNCNDIFQFQMIAKAGTKYKEAYHLVNGEKEPVQRVNRVYATTDERFGKLYKVKAEDDSEAKIDSLPEHCIIDNDNHLTIDDVDKTFYIEMAKKRINDFKGIKPEKKTTRRTKKMATATSKAPKNVYQKLIEAREKLLGNVKQTGKNMNLAYKYFELADIVPAITPIFKELGLIAIDNFTADVATLTIVNCDNPEEKIDFSAPFNQIAPIVSNAGKQVTNDMQALGSSITYMRRYLYFLALDIVVADDIEPTVNKDTNATESKPQAPATPEKRQEIKEEVTAPADNASETQIKGLKAVCKKLIAKDPANEERVTKIAVQTNGFTNISKTDCEALVAGLNKMLEEGESNAES